MLELLGAWEPANRKSACRNGVGKKIPSLCLLPKHGQMKQGQF